jgi:rhodanese-related sulfurtransferase
MKSVKDLVSEANAKVTTVSPEEAIAMVKDPNVVFVDLRDTAELQQEGKVPNAVHVDRGMLEFAIDPGYPRHNPVFASGKKIMFYCAGGGRSALAAATAQDMGVKNVAHVRGGFRGWRDAGGPVESAGART